MSKRHFRFSRGPLERLRAHARELPGESAVPTPPLAEDEAGLGLQSASVTHIGLVRANNQDTVLEKDRVFGVCDGMGGHRGGEVASAVAAESFLAALEGREPSAEAMREAVDAANTAVWEKAQGDEELSGMGTTLTALWLSGGRAFIAHVGDSRCYRMRDGSLRRITEDHSMVMEMLRAGVITAEQAETHPMRNIITRAVGTEETVETDLIEEDSRPGDIWLVCSDGLYSMVPDEAISSTLAALGRQPDQAVQALLDAALAAGGRDNISISLIRDRGDSR